VTPRTGTLFVAAIVPSRKHALCQLSRNGGSPVIIVSKIWVSRIALWYLHFLRGYSVLMQRFLRSLTFVQFSILYYTDYRVCVPKNALPMHVDIAATNPQRGRFPIVICLTLGVAKFIHLQTLGAISRVALP
jgi:hypothetical protein